MTAPARRPFPFVVGCGRSGTTFLAAMLDSHSALAIPGESGFLLAAARSPFSPGSRSHIEAFCSLLTSFDRFRRWNLDTTALAAYLEARHPSDALEALRGTYAFYAAQHAKPYYGDKTPDHVLQIPRLAAMFPEAQFIHLVRDGRDVALATLAVDWGPSSVAGAAHYWRHRVGVGRRDGRLLGPERYLEVRYESLLTATRETLLSVTEYLGLPFEERMLSYGEAAERQLSMSPDATADRSLRRPPTSGLRDWRRDMAQSDVDVFEAIAGSLLDELGYERGGRSGAVSKLRAGLASTAEAARAARRRLAGARQPTSKPV